MKDDMRVCATLGLSKYFFSFFFPFSQKKVTATLSYFDVIMHFVWLSDKVGWFYGLYLQTNQDCAFL